MLGEEAQGDLTQFLAHGALTPPSPTGPSACASRVPPGALEPHVANADSPCRYTGREIRA